MTQVPRQSPISAGSFKTMVGCLLVGLVLAGMLALDRLRWPIDGVEAHATGTFAERGDVPSGAPAPQHTRYWSSWAGSDQNRGAITVGPFPAPKHVELLGAGYPRFEQNRLYFENLTTGETIDPEWGNFAESWTKVTQTFPPSWVGQPIVIQAVDEATGWGGWLAFSEPAAVPHFVVGLRGLPVRLSAFLLVGLNLAILAFGARAAIRPWIRGVPGIELMAVAGVLGSVAYIVFWAYFAHRGIGVFFNWALLVGAIALASRRRDPAFDAEETAPLDWRVPLVLMAGTAVFYFAILHEFSAGSAMSHLAQYRFSASMPGDNAIPQIFAERLLHGESPRALIGDWQSSDRPPLQAGWVLMAIPIAQWAGVDFDTAAQSAGVWFQLWWIPAVWLLLRNLGVRPGTVSLLVVALVPTGFFLHGSIYVWPKLGGGAFVVAAYVLWFLVRDEQLSARVRFAGGGVLAALGWLCHGGVAFSFLALAPFVAWHIVRRKQRGWFWAAAALAVGALPWLVYQKCYEPPGNRLVKWHLAGSIPIDERGFVATLSDAYSHTNWQQWKEARRANVRMVMAGPWSDLLRFRFDPPQSWRDASAFTFFNLGWWNLGFLALPALTVGRGPRWAVRPLALNVLGTLIGWLALTLALWICLMFIGGSTVVHQGSYVPLLALFPLLALALWRVHPWLFAGVVLAQVSLFAAVWLSRPAHIPGSGIRMDSVLVGAVAMSVLLFVSASAFFRERSRGPTS